MSENNDRFKFRVWDNDQQEYVKDYDDGNDARISITLNEGTIAIGYKDLGNFYTDGDQHNHYQDDIWREVEDYIIEQCTGLKDCKGRLIFEGDIVRVYEWLDGKIWKTQTHDCIIVFKKAKFDIDKPYCHQSLQDNTVEIIGNIHEEK